MNPWTLLPLNAPFVLNEDGREIAKFNSRAVEKVRLETALLPEPFVGRIGAPVVLLALNPGIRDEDFAVHEDEAFQQRIRACHRQEVVDWPYYYLHPVAVGSGARWSARVLGPLIRGVGKEAVAHGVVMFEYLAYHSRHFAHHRLNVPSQQYTFGLVETAIAGAKAIFVTRGRGLWEAAVPGLRDHRRVFRTRSVRNIIISPRNCAEGWEAAKAGILEGR